VFDFVYHSKGRLAGLGWAGLGRLFSGAGRAGRGARADDLRLVSVATLSQAGGSVFIVTVGVYIWYSLAIQTCVEQLWEAECRNSQEEVEVSYTQGLIRYQCSDPVF
jgi:hypothetical protein